MKKEFETRQAAGEFTGALQTATFSEVMQQQYYSMSNSDKYAAFGTTWEDLR